MAGTSHIGKAGHLAAMAEFLLRGYNVAMPEVDLGGDIFVVHDTSGKLWRIQVKTGQWVSLTFFCRESQVGGGQTDPLPKTAIGKPTQYGWSGQFLVGEQQIETRKEPDLYYVLALRCGTQWEFIVLSRRKLRREYRRYEVGTLSGESVTFTVRCHATDVFSSDRSWQRFRNIWPEWPTL